MHGSTASNDVGPHTLLANARRGASCERSCLHSLLRGRYPPEREERRQRYYHCCGRAVSSPCADRRDRPPEARCRHDPDSGPQGESFELRGVKTLGIYTSVVRGFRSIRNLQNGPTQEISTASHRTAQMLIGRSAPGSSHPRPKAARFAATFSPTNTWQVGFAIYGCLEIEDIC